MDDLVEKLRRRAKQNPTPGGLLVMVDPGTLNEAAAEIERLTSDLTRAYQRGWNAGYGEANREWQTSR